jgi:hypothetical protein
MLENLLRQPYELKLRQREYMAIRKSYKQICPELYP